MGDITESFKKQYADNLEMLVNQPGFQAEDVFSVIRFDGEEYWFDQMGSVSLRQKAARSEELPIVDPSFRKRRILMSTHHARSFIDQDDQLQMLLDPSSDYLKAFALACKVKKWQTGLAAAVGPAYQGKEAPVAVPLPESQKLEAGGTGFTFAKLQKAVLTLRNFGGTMPDEQPIVLYTSSGEADLMNDDKVGSSDYNNRKVLSDGHLAEFYGCKFRVLDDFRDLVNDDVTRLLAKSGSTRTAIVLAKSGVKLGFPKSGRNTEGKIQPNADRDCPQVSAALRAGGTRSNDYAVVTVDYTEAATL